MKKVIVISIAVMMGLSLTCAAVSFAQVKGSGAIFEYKTELSLTDKQEKNLRAITTNLQSYLAAKQKELDVLRAEIGNLITEKVDLRKIKTKLESMAKIQVDMSYEGIASGRAAEEELTAAQLSKWHDIQAAFRKNLLDAQAAASKAKNR